MIKRLFTAVFFAISIVPTASSQDIKICTLYCPAVSQCSLKVSKTECSCNCRLPSEDEIKAKKIPSIGTPPEVLIRFDVNKEGIITFVPDAPSVQLIKPDVLKGLAIPGAVAEFRDPVSGRPVRELVQEAREKEERQRQHDERMNQIMERMIEKGLMRPGGQQ